MGCETNHFCAALSPGLRSRLCTGCQRQLLGEGSIENFVSTKRNAIILLDGLMVGMGYGDADLRNWPATHLPRYLVVTPGYLLNFKGTPDQGEDAMIASSYQLCKTKCCIARLDQGLLEELAEASPEIGDADKRSMFEWSLTMSEFLSIALSPSMNVKIEKLMAFLTQWNLWLSESAIAELLSCSRASVSRAFTAIAKSNRLLYDAYRSNKGRTIAMQSPE